MRKIVTIIGFFTVFSGVISAQNINPNVEVKRDYENRLPAIHKSKLSTDFNDSLNNFSINFNYIVFEKSYKDLYEFAPTASAKIQKPENPYNYTMYARAGVALPLSPDSFIAYSPKIERIKIQNRFLLSSNLMIYASHKSYWGKAPLQWFDYGTEHNGTGNTEKQFTEKLSQKVAAHDSRTEAGIIAGHYWKTGVLGASVKYTNGYNQFYGKNIYLDETGYKGVYSDINSRHFNRLDINFNINSLEANKEIRGFNYSGNVDYNFVGDNSFEKLKAHYIAATAEIGPSIGKYSSFLVKFSIRNSNASILNLSHNYGLMDITPSYNTKQGNWQFSFGGTFSTKYTDSPVGKYYTMFFAKAKAQYLIVKDLLAVYAVADGGNKMNNYSSLLEQNPWLSPFADCMINSVPVRVSGGFTGNICGILDYDISAGYSKEKGLPQFVTSLENPATFDTYYSSTNRIFFKATAAVSTKDFIGNFKMQYNIFSRSDDLKPLNYPPFEIKLSGEYNYMQRVFVGMSIYGRSNTPTLFAIGYKTTTAPSANGSITTTGSYLYDSNIFIKGFANVGLSAKYVINEMLSVYLNADNILGQRPCLVQQYYQKGISIGGGVIVKL